MNRELSTLVIKERSCGCVIVWDTADPSVVEYVVVSVRCTKV